MSTTNTPRCCSDLKLDRLLVGDCDDVEAAALRAHLEQSAPCRARYETLAADRDAFAAAPPTLDFAPRAPASSSSSTATMPARRRWSVAAGLSALAAGVAVVAMQRPVADDDVVRSKGAALDVTIHRKRGDVVSPVLRGDTVAGGDVLRAEVSTSTPANVVVVSVDDDGPAAWNPSAVHVDAGSTTLPFAVELSDEGADLRVFVYACERSVDVATCERAAGALVDGCRVSATTLKRGPR